METFKSLEPAYKWGVGLLLLELGHMLYWLSTMIYLVASTSSEGQRIFHAFLGVHIVTLPSVLLYIMESRNKKRYMFVIWILLATFFLDLYGILDSNLHLKSAVLPGEETAFKLIQAASIIAPCISLLAVTWYLGILCMTYSNVKKLNLVFGDYDFDDDEETRKPLQTRIKSRLRSN